MMHLRAAALLVILLLAGCERKADAPAKDVALPTDAHVQVLALNRYVILGETFRLANVSVPASGAAAKCPAEAALAERGLKQMREYIASLPHAIYDRDVSIGNDRNGDVVALVKMNGDDLGNVLKGEGFAREWVEGGVDWCASAAP